MIVCLCRGVSDRAIQAAIAGGACSAEQVSDACGAGADCRACCSFLEALVEETRGALYGGAAAVH